MAKNDILLLDAINVFVRSAQMARVFGIQFIEVLTRGSQFRVESMLLRVAKQFSFLPPSISVEQRNRMDSPITIPLNLEPVSGIYRDPVAVLDFQSLYPSVCIAYNYCFSTCLGKVSEICSSTNQQSIKLGALQYTTLTANEIEKLLEMNLIHISPTGSFFLNKFVKGVCFNRRRICQEGRETRNFADNAQRTAGHEIDDQKVNEALQKQPDAQQLALKLVANVTYGYTAANWSGRMPCDVVADAIVSKGREALENAINLINNAPDDKYKGAKVIYGDTDSAFVLFKGCSRAEAFKLGQQIAEDVTSANPYPMKLKFEKIMQPCVLFTKKRYVGNSYENSPDEEPKFDAKGIETVRRDGCLFVSKLVEKCLKILFEKDAQTAIQYLRIRLRQLERFPISDFILNSEFRDGYAESAVIPAKKLALERKQKSSRLAPTHGERLPFLIVNQESKTRKRAVPLIECVVSWEDFLANPQLTINYNYYVGRQLLGGALKRIFDLVPIKLNWHPYSSSTFCIGCNKAGPYPFCPRCSTSVNVLQRALCEQSILHRQECRAIRACNECISKEIECNLDFVVCSNTSCNIMERRQQFARTSIYTNTQKHPLYMKNNAPIYLSD
ncbi:DNA polymerase [Aphelenchoides bicaudatus]|nr:DNA polymerase [Aphelenchoides bicaudatus]